MRIKWCRWSDITNVLSWASVFLGIISLVLVAFPELVKIWIVLPMIGGSIAVSYVLQTLVRTFSSKKTIMSNGRKITIRTGNIFDADGLIVIPFNRTFDTIVDDDLISSTSIHGQFINSIINSVEELDIEISKQLSFEEYDEVEKKSGKTKDYGPGKVVSITQNNRRYLLLALSKFDLNNEASCTMSEYYKAIMGLLDYVNHNGQGYGISVPLIGSGLSRLFDDPESNLQMLVTLIKIHKSPFPKQVTIVLGEGMLDLIDLDNVN